MKVEEIHFTDLKRIEQSAAHFRWSLQNKPPKQTPCMRYGSLVHCATLGGPYVVYEGERRGNAWKEFEAAHEGDFIVTRKEVGRALEAAKQVLSDPVAGPHLVGDREREWTTTIFGRRAGGRIDVSNADTVELKFTQSTEPGRFARHALRMGWHAQVAWYREARRAMGEDPGRGIIVGVESKEPFTVTVLELTPRALEEGLKLCSLWVERLNVCEAFNEWPGYVQTAVPLDIVEDAGLIIDGEEIAA